MKELFTLSRGARARLFLYEENAGVITFFTGVNHGTIFDVRKNDIDRIINHFKDKGWFLLGNNVTDLKPNSLGSLFKTFDISPKNASHVAAYLVEVGKLLSRDVNGYIELKVK